MLKHIKLLFLLIVCMVVGYLAITTLKQGVSGLQNGGPTPTKGLFPKFDDTNTSQVSPGVTTVQQSSCPATQADAIGPYYIPQESFRTDLADNAIEGDRITISGVVQNEACEPVPDAIIDVWQADSHGVYHDNELRGRIHVGPNGDFSFNTIKPGQYEARPPHIHIKIDAGGYKELTTQLYVDDTGPQELRATTNGNVLTFNFILVRQ